MANPTMKKVEIQIPSEVYKAAKLQATQAGKSVPEWIASLVEAAKQPEDPQAISALDWGRIDSRIDQRTTMLERQLERLTKQVEQLLNAQRLQQSFSDRPMLSSSSIR